MTKQLISYIFPIYNESPNIDLLYDTMVSTTSKITEKYDIEFIFINDGSSDDSLEKLSAVQVKDPRVVVIDLSRNYGHQMAVTAGLDYSRGDAVIIMDSDMQDPPAVSLELIKSWELGNDVVYAQRRTRKDSVFKKVTADIFYRVIHRIADIHIPRNTGDFRLLDRKVVEELKRYREHNRFLRGMVSHVGYKQVAVQFDRDERHAGKTGYPFKKMVKFAFDGILGFSSAPLKAISRLGYFMAILSIVGVLYALSLRLFFPDLVVEGWTFTVIAIFLVGGIQLIMLGVLGEYIGRIYTEVQNRPLYSVSSVLSSEKGKNGKNER